MLTWKKWGEWEYVHADLEADPRAGGVLGQIFALIQTLGSFKSRMKPLHVAVCFPPYLSISIPWFWREFTKRPMRYATFRVGWRYDVNWRGYILDVVIKLRNEVSPLLVVLAIGLALAGCAKPKPIVQTIVVKEPIEVQVPVPVKPTPPPELLAPFVFKLPTFIPPTDPKASSALDVDGERLLRGLVEDLLAQIAALRAFISAP